MKNWFARWFGGAPRRGNSAPASLAPAVDLAFYRWLAGSAGGDAPPATERLILDELARLALAPDKAAELVPRVPAVIPELLRGLRDENVAGAELSRMVAQDLVLVAEVIREANSPCYRSTTPVRNIEGAVMLLGQNGLRMLLARVAFRPVVSMQAGRFVAQGIARQWEFPDAVADAIGGGAGGGPLGSVLAAADALAKLRLRVDAGEPEIDDPLMLAHAGPRLRPIFDQLQPQES